ncbi:ribosomal protein bL12 [Streptomyces sp. NPDC004126]|uniref:ribosomal protein bL12 n=1 Tax=Streptomyces sp. NPDC004126 TaxID=3390695 RepID=UPI003D05A696
MSSTFGGGAAFYKVITDTCGAESGNGWTSMPDQENDPAAGAVRGEGERTEFDVVLAEGGAMKVNVIKALREVTGMGLAQAKEKVDGAPSVIVEAVSWEAAADVKAKLESAGGRVELR